MFGHGYEIPVMVPLCECGRTDAQYDGMLTPDAVTRCRVQLQVDTLAQPQARTAQPLLRMPIGQEDAHNGRHTDPFSATPRATDAQEPPSACWPEEAWVRRKLILRKRCIRMLGQHLPGLKSGNSCFDGKANTCIKN